MMQTNSQKLKAAGLLPVIMLPVILLLSFFVGKFNIDFSVIFNSESLDYGVFWRLRVPRSIMALISGAALGMAGNTLQTVFRNPLASPDVIGVASGASAGAAFAIVFAGSSLFSVPFSALCGGLLAVGMVLLLGRLSGKGDTVTLLLAGIVINAIFQALLMVIKLCADSEQTLAGVEFWLMGSFSDTTLSSLVPVLIPVVAGLAALFIMQRPLRLLLLPDDEAAMLGVNVRLTRYLALLFATLVTAAVISENGIISFVGLIAPHIARRLDRTGKSGSMLMSGIIGAELMLVSDMAVRVIGTSELPISVATSVIGAPVLFIMVCRRERVEISGKQKASHQEEAVCLGKKGPGRADRTEASDHHMGSGNGIRENLGCSVKAQSVSAGYSKKKIIRDISFDIPTGQFCSIIGQNGSGKTTLIKALTGLTETEGKVQIPENTGYMAALSDVALPVLVSEMVMLGWYRELGLLKKAGEREKRAVADILQKLGLQAYADRDFRTLSTGQKQLVCLARTMVREPELLILDEPESALDFDKRAYVMRLLREYVKKDRTVLICSHDVNLMLKYADRIIMLKDGRMIGDSDTVNRADGLEKQLASVYGDIELISHKGSLMMVDKEMEDN